MVYVTIFKFMIYKESIQLTKLSAMKIVSANVLIGINKQKEFCIHFHFPLSAHCVSTATRFPVVALVHPKLPYSSATPL